MWGWLRGRRRSLAIGAGAVVVYALIGFFVVPPVARSEIVKLAASLLHREAKVERVTFNPFTLAGEVDGLDLADRDGAPLLHVDRIAANLQLSGIFRRAWRLKDLEIEGPSIEARILPDGKPSVADLFEPAPGEAAHRKKSGLPRLIVDRFAVRGGRLEFTDASRSPRFVQAFEPLDLEVHDLTTIPEETGDHEITIGLGREARLHWAGRQTIEPLHLEGRVTITSIPLARVAAYAAPDVPIVVSAGRADVDLAYDVHRAADGSIEAAFKDASVRATGIAAGPRDGSESWIELPSVEATGIAGAWPAARVDVASLRLARPKVLVRRSASGLNWAAALPPARKEGGPPAGAAKPWSATIGKVEVAGGEVTLDDRAVSPAVTTVVSGLDAGLTPVSTDPKRSVAAELSATIDGKGRLTATGTIVPEGPTAAVDLTLSDLDLVPFRPYAAALPGARIRDGRASVKGRVTLSRGAPRVRFEGTGSIDDLQVAGAGEDRLVAWKSARASGVRVSVDPSRVRVAEIRLDGAFLALRIAKDGSVNLSRLSRGEAEGTAPPAAAPPAETPPSPFPVEVSKIVFVDAGAEYTDESLILPFGTKIHSLKGDIRDVSTTAAAPARLDVEGRVAEAGYVKADGTLRLSDPLAATDVRVIFRNVAMPDLTPYAAQFAGYSLEKGVLDVDVHYTVKDARLVGDHHVVAKDLVLGPKVEGAKGAGIPVRLAIALLKDKDGKIDLEVPVEGTVNSPEFNYRSVVWQAFKKILAKVATAPFRAIGRLFGADRPDLDLVGFPAGRSDIPDPEKETLSKLAAALVHKPAISLVVEGRFDPVADAAALKRARLESAIDAKRTGDTTLDAILESIYVETFSKERLEARRAEFTSAPPADEGSGAGSPKGAKGTAAPQPTFDAPGFYEALRSELLASFPVTDADLSDLAKRRAGAIAAALTAPGGLDPTRVTGGNIGPVQRKQQGSELVASEMTMSAKD